MSHHSFVRLIGAKHGRPVLMPKGSGIICINAADPEKQEPDNSFWVEYAYGRDHAHTKALCVKGPLEDILDALDAETTISEPALLRDLEEAREEAALHCRAASVLREQLGTLKAENTALVQLNKSMDWAETGFNQGTFPYWSTVRLIPGDASERWGYRFFACPVGQPGQGFAQGMTWPFTNIKEGGRLPGIGAATVYAIRLEFLEGAVADIEKVKEQGVLKWDFTQTSFPISPVSALTWDEAGRTGVVSLADPDFVPESAPAPEPAPPPKPSPESQELWLAPAPNVFKVGGDGVVLPNNTTFSVMLDFGLGEPAFAGPVTVRLTLATRIAVPIEIG